MTFDEYINIAAKTDSEDADTDNALINIALGACGESGEFADHVKKYLGQGHPLDEDAMDYEMGDVLWYIAKWCRRRNTTFEHLMTLNIDKLSKRYPEGYFTTERSMNRDA